MIDPLVSLALSLHSQKGIFALLLGSGISRAAGIPTGWEVVQDLCLKLAVAEEEECETDPAAWFHEKYGKDPDYSELLEKLGHTPDERQAMLRGYFEPSSEEREEGKKTPTAAHRAIAWLVSIGAIKVIVTTNFDRLLEQALADAGVQPTVIASADSAKGATPLVHSACTVIKVHGDYQDTRIKNSHKELAGYENKINGLLDRVLDEYGLLVCGWSGEWDVALRAAIERAPNRRFSTYWAVRGHVGEAAQGLIDLRKAQTIQGMDADKLFVTLKEKVEALERIDRQHPLTAKIAVARLKRYLEDGKVIAANDLIMDETERVVGQLGEENFPFQGVRNPDSERMSRIDRYDNLAEILASLIATGCFWGGEIFSDIWPRSVSRLANSRDLGSGTATLPPLHNYPAMLCFYAGGIAAISRGQYKNLAGLFNVEVKHEGAYSAASAALNNYSVMEFSNQQRMPGMKRESSPLSNHLYKLLLSLMSGLIPEEKEFSKCFNQFEMLVSLAYADKMWIREDANFVPWGRFIWEHDYHPERLRGEDWLHKQYEDQQEKWPPYACGIFGRDVHEFASLIERWREKIGRLKQHLNNHLFWS